MTVEIQDDSGGWFPDGAFLRILEAGQGAWVDDIRTPERETLELAAAGAAKVLGPDHGVTQALAKAAIGGGKLIRCYPRRYPRNYSDLCVFS